MLLLHVLGFTSVALAAVSSSSCQTISLSTSTSDIKTYWNTQTTTAYKSYISKYQETITTTLPDKTTTAANTITTTIGTVTSSASIISATATATIYSKTVAYKTGTISKVSTITNTLPQTLPTTTIAPSPGFTAIGPYLRAQGHSASLSRQDPAKRAVPFGEDGSEAAEIERRQSPQFANFVLCDMYVQTVAPTSVTTTLAPKTVTAKGALVTVTVGPMDTVHSLTTLANNMSTGPRCHQEDQSDGQRRLDDDIRGYSKCKSLTIPKHCTDRSRLPPRSTPPNSQAPTSPSTPPRPPQPSNNPNQPTTPPAPPTTWSTPSTAAPSTNPRPTPGALPS